MWGVSAAVYAKRAVVGTHVIIPLIRLGACSVPNSVSGPITMEFGVQRRVTAARVFSMALSERKNASIQ